MSLNRNSQSANSGKSTLKFTNAPEGENEGRLLYVADLGLQRKEYMGEYVGDVQQIALCFEIIGQTVELDGSEKPRILWTKPFYIYKTMGEKSKEYQYYKVFDPMAQPESVPDWDAQLGKPCNVIVQHVKGKGANADRLYDNIKDLVSIPAKYQSGVAPMKLKPAVANCEDTDSDAIKSMFGLSKMVWERRIKQGGSSEKPAGNFDDFDDDIPF